MFARRCLAVHNRSPPSATIPKPPQPSLTVRDEVAMAVPIACPAEVDIYIISTGQSPHCTPHFTLLNPHSPVYTAHSTLYIPHTPHLTLQTLQCTPHSTLYLPTSHSTPYTLHCAFHTSHSTIPPTHYILHLAIHLHFTLHTLHSIPFHTPQSTLVR